MEVLIGIIRIYLFEESASVMARGLGKTDGKNESIGW